MGVEQSKKFSTSCLIDIWHQKCSRCEKKPVDLLSDLLFLYYHKREQLKDFLKVDQANINVIDSIIITNGCVNDHHLKDIEDIKKRTDLFEIVSHNWLLFEETFKKDLKNQQIFDAHGLQFKVILSEVWKVFDSVDCELKSLNLLEFKEKTRDLILMIITKDDINNILLNYFYPVVDPKKYGHYYSANEVNKNSSSDIYRECHICGECLDQIVSNHLKSVIERKFEPLSLPEISDSDFSAAENNPTWMNNDILGNIFSYLIFPHELTPISQTCKYLYDWLHYKTNFYWVAKLSYFKQIPEHTDTLLNVSLPEMYNFSSTNDLKSIETIPFSVWSGNLYKQFKGFNGLSSIQQVYTTMFYQCDRANDLFEMLFLHKMIKLNMEKNRFVTKFDSMDIDMERFWGYFQLYWLTMRDSSIPLRRITLIIGKKSQFHYQVIRRLYSSLPNMEKVQVKIILNVGYVHLDSSQYFNVNNLETSALISRDEHSQLFIPDHKSCYKVVKMEFYGFPPPYQPWLLPYSSLNNV